MKLAVLATAIFNNLLFNKAKLSTTIYYDLNILKTGRDFQSVTTVNSGLPYPHASSKTPESRVVTRTFSDGQTDDRTMAAGASVTWTHCSILFEVTWGKTRCVRADAA
jgi:hypothetical protein